MKNVRTMWINTHSTINVAPHACRPRINQPKCAFVMMKRTLSKAVSAVGR